MDAEFTLKYGSETKNISVCGAASIETILPKEMSEIDDLQAAFLQAVTDGAIGSRPLREMVSPDDLVTIVVSDITRSWMRQDLIMPMLVEYLHKEAGVGYQQMTILIALGTHRPSSPEEMVRICSEEVCRKVKVVDHDCDADDLVTVGTTSRGTVVQVNPLVIGRKVIVLGGTVHHMMAGFGGGRKNILPGVAGRETIRQNHRRALDPEKAMSDARVGCCKLRDNPIHEDMAEAAGMVPVAYSLNLVVSSNGKHAGIFGGDLDAAWKASCDFQRACYEVPIDHQADIVICSTGGYPKDMNLYQGCKGMLNAMRALKPGGIMLWLCKCPEGGGAPDYFDWLTPLREDRLDAALRADFTIGGYIFYLTCEQLHLASHVYTLTELDAGLVRPMGIEASRDLSALMAKLDFTGKSVYVLPFAGSVVPVTE